MKIFRVLLIPIVIVLFLEGCTRYKIEAPEGFAEVTRQGTGKFLAVSPEGVKFSVKTEKNYPKQDVDYWKTAMGDHLEKAGYTLVSGPIEFETANSNGIYYEWGAPYQGKDYIYFTGLIVSGRRLLIIEAGGEYGIFKNYEENIVKSLKGLTAP